jgi:hypothetical protein
MVLVLTGGGSEIFRSTTSSCTILGVIDAMSVIIYFVFSADPFCMLNAYHIILILTISYSFGLATSICVTTTVHHLIILGILTS